MLSTFGQSAVKELSDFICQLAGAKSLEFGEQIQTLWSGYGVIQRAKLHGIKPDNVVIKHIDVSHARSNRRGWGGEFSHQRKVKSYRIEREFYESYADHCDIECKVPRLVVAHEKADDAGWIIVLEDLDALGFDQRRDVVTQQDIHACLAWLASFHASFMNSDGKGLWPAGTYWHLATRPDELAAMPAGALKQAAAQIAAYLNDAKFKTLVHGDAKLANFCFGDKNDENVAAVDFQYVGRGCGMKDVAYFISSCLNGVEATAQQESLLQFYFKELRDSLCRCQIEIDFDALETEWRFLYPFAWADFCRFLSGWSPGHWKLNRYNDRITKSVLTSLGYHDHS